MPVFPPYGIFCIHSSLEGEECSVTTWQVHNCVLAKQNHFVVIQKLSMLVIRYVTRITYVDLWNCAIVRHRHQQIAARLTTDLLYKSTQARIPREYRKWWKTIYVCSPCDSHKLGAGIPSGGAFDVWMDRATLASSVVDSLDGVEIGSVRQWVSYCQCKWCRWIGYYCTSFISVRY